MFFKPVVTERSSSSSRPDRHRRSAGAPSARLKHNRAHMKSSLHSVSVPSDETLVTQPTYQLKLHPPRQGRPLHRFDAASGQPALLHITPKKKKKLTASIRFFQKISCIVTSTPNLKVQSQSTSYLIFRRLLSTDSSRTSWGKRTISLSWTPCEDRADKFSLFCGNKYETRKQCHIRWTLHTWLLKCFCVSFFQILMLLSSYQ